MTPRLRRILLSAPLAALCGMVAGALTGADPWRSLLCALGTVAGGVLWFGFIDKGDGR